MCTLYGDPHIYVFKSAESIVSSVAGAGNAGLFTCNVEGNFTLLENNHILVEGEAVPVDTRPGVG